MEVAVSLGRMMLVPLPTQPTLWSHHLPTQAASKPLPPSLPKAQVGWERIESWGRGSPRGGPSSCEL